MFFRFKIPNKNLSTFNKDQKKQIERFQKFVMQRPDGFCCVCMKVLYHQERKYRSISSPDKLPCRDWGFQPMTKDYINQLKYMVCATHQKTNENNFPRYEYPGWLHFLPMGVKFKH